MSGGSRMWQSASTTRTSLIRSSRLGRVTPEYSDAGGRYTVPPARGTHGREDDVATALLDGVRVVDLAGEPAARAGRILADLGADVVLVEPLGGHPLRAQPNRFLAWAAGKRSVTVSGTDDPALDGLLRDADIVIDT